MTCATSPALCSLPQFNLFTRVTNSTHVHKKTDTCYAHIHVSIHVHVSTHAIAFLSQVEVQHKSIILLLPSSTLSSSRPFQLPFGGLMNDNLHFFKFYDVINKQLCMMSSTCKRHNLLLLQMYMKKYISLLHTTHVSHSPLGLNLVLCTHEHSTSSLKLYDIMYKYKHIICMSSAIKMNLYYYC